MFADATSRALVYAGRAGTRRHVSLSTVTFDHDRTRGPAAPLRLSRLPGTLRRGRLLGLCGRLTAAGLLAVIGTLLVWPAPADAHAELVRTSPVQGSVVPVAPAEVTITFSEPVTPVPDKIQVAAPDGTGIAGRPTISGAVLHIPVRTSVPRGTYLVSYRVISDDGHPVGATFSYSVGSPSAVAGGGTAPETAGGGANAGAGEVGRTDPPVAIAMAVAHGLGYAGLILVAGPALMLVAFWPRRLPRTGPTRLACTGLGLLMLTTLLELYLQVPYGNGGGLASTSPSQFTDVLASRYGVLHLVRLGVLVAVALLIGPHLAGRAGPVRRSLLIVLGVAGVATWGMAGHPGASALPALTVISDTAHLAAAAVWLGGLVVLVGYLLRRADASELGAILPVWSSWAMAAVTVLVLAGVTQALVEIGSAGALVHTAYGRLVLLKAVVLAAVLVVAAFARRRATSGGAVGGAPRADQAARADQADHAERAERASGAAGAGSGPGLGRLRRSVLAELLGAVVILGLASALVQTPPASHAEPAAAAPAGTPSATAPQQGPYSATLTCDLYQLQVLVDPAGTGDNDVHLYAFTPQGAPLKVLDWAASATPPGRGVPPIAIRLQPVTDSHATGQLTLPTAGTWQFRFTLRTNASDEATVNTNVNVS